MALRSLVVLGIGLALAALIGYYVARASYIGSYVSYDGLSDLWVDVVANWQTDYIGAIAAAGCTGIASCAIGFVSLSLWKFRRVLRCRDCCDNCKHGLVGLALDTNTRTKCPECAASKKAIVAWGEVDATQAGHPVFKRPDWSLVPLHSHKLTKRLALATVFLVVLATTAFGVRRAVRERNIQRDVQLAKADYGQLRREYVELVGAVESEPRSGGIRETLAEIKQGRDASLTQLRASSPAFPGNAVVLPNEYSLWLGPASTDDHATQTEAKAEREFTLAWLKSVRNSEWYTKLDQLGSADPTWCISDETDVSTQVEFFTSLRHVSLVNLTRVHLAQPGDDEELLHACKSGLAMTQAAASVKSLLGTLVAASMHQKLAERILDARGRGFSEATLREVQELFEQTLPVDPREGLRGEGLHIRMYVADHFSDPHRIRRGLADPSIDAIEESRSIMAAVFETSTDAEGRILGSYEQNRDAGKQLASDLLARVMTS